MGDGAVILRGRPQFPFAGAGIFTHGTERPPRTFPSHALKISLVTETYPPEINGVAMTLSHLVEGLAARGHDVTVLRPRQSGSDRPTDGAPYREHLFPGMPIPGYPLLKLGLPAGDRLRRLWREERPDLVHLATEGPLGLSALHAARALGLPVSSTFHTNFHSYSRHYGFPFLARVALAYLRYFHNRTAVTLSPTSDLNAALERDGFRNVRLLARGVNARVFSPAHRDEALRARFGATPDSLLVVHVSRLAAEKNYRLLFRTYDAIRAVHPSARFVVVGDGPLRRRFERRYPWCHFTGFLPRPQLAATYASADLFLYPSVTETFGNVVTEAMASGLPVVAFNYAAAARYLRHEQNGYLVPLENRDAFLLGALQLASDSLLRQALGRAARLTAEGISWDAVIDGFERDLALVATGPNPLLACNPGQA